MFDFTTAAPSVAPEIQAELLALSPPTFLRWSKEKSRWELWCALGHVRGAKKQLSDKDRWNTDHQCWMRYLQTYQTADGQYAPADRALLIGLALADGLRDRFYETHIEDAETAVEAERLRKQRDLSGGAARYFHGVPNPIVGRHFNSGWRRGSY